MAHIHTCGTVYYQYRQNPLEVADQGHNITRATSGHQETILAPYIWGLKAEARPANGGTGFCASGFSAWSTAEPCGPS
jgi:hypothetical protein